MTEDLDNFTKDIIDKENKVVVMAGESAESFVQKRNEEFEILFANQYVELGSVWRKDLADNVVCDTVIPVYHPGHPFSETPVQVGSYRVYNEFGVDEVQQQFITDLTETAADFGTGNLDSLLCYTLFEWLQRAAQRPMSAVFDSLADEFERRMQDALSDGSKFLQKEGGPVSLEFKASEWLEKEENHRHIVENVVDEFDNGSRLVICGLDENGQEVKLLQKNRLPYERIQGLESSLEEEYNGTDVHVLPIPVENERIALSMLRV